MSELAGYKLFTPLTIGKDLHLKNRIVLSPLTRARSDKDTHNPNEHNKVYYEQRVSAGLIITEATAISPQGFGWYGAPALYTETHAVEWKKITDAVHAKGGKIFVQMQHFSRQSHSSFNPKNEIVAPSAVPVHTGQHRDANGEHVGYEMPRALETEEIPGIVEDYRKCAVLAKKAGFDGIEIGGGNGYLVDSFLQSVTNKRTDQYGGSIENRARFLLEVVDALATEFPTDRIGMRYGPNSSSAGMGSPDNFAQFIYTAEQLNKKGLGYISLMDGIPNDPSCHDKDRFVTAADLKKVFSGAILANNGYTRDVAEGALRSGATDLVSFGRLYISNPDLVERFQNDWPLAPIADYIDWWNPDRGTEGYITFKPYAPAETK